MDDGINDEKEPKNISEENRTLVDLSNEGLTVVPITLFKKRFIRKLDLSDNNIRSLPIDIVNLSSLTHLNLSRNGFRCTSSDDVSAIPKDMKKLRKLEYLNISECNLSFIPSSLWEIVSLTSLDISKNKIFNIPADIGNLDQLKWFNAQHTGLITLPEEIVGCASLETLLLYGNQIMTLPYILADLINLKTFSINLRHMANNVDKNTESLLQSGQIKSDHISNTIFTLPRVEKIELEYCKINFVNCFHSQYLSELLLSGNLFREIPHCLLDLMMLTILDLSGNLLHTINKEIVRLKKLRILLLSKNHIKMVCCDIFAMEYLEVMDLSHNKLQNIFLPDILRNQSLTSLNLSYNKLDVIPKNIINLESLENIFLNNNHITEIPLELSSMKNISKVHQYEGIYKVGLWLLNNPISFPPSNIWTTTDITKIYSVLEKTKIQRSNKMQPIRVIMLGEDNFQKRNFLSKFLNKSLTNNFQFLTINKWISPNKIPFVIVNIDSNPIYSMLWRYFIEDNSLVWLFINEEIHCLFEQLNKWVGIITDSALDCVIQLIFIKQESLVEYNGESLYESEEYRSNMLSKIKEKYNTNKIIFLPDIITFSKSDEVDTLDLYKFHLEYQAIDPKLFKEDKNVVFLKETNSAIEKYCKSKKVLYLNIDVVLKELKEFLEINDQKLRTCLEILHKQGKILWFKKSKQISSKIYPFISTFLSSIMSLIKINYEEDLDLEKNPLLRANGLKNVNIFNEIKENFLNYGEISLLLYKNLSFNLSKSLLLKDFLCDANVCWMVPILSVPDRNSSTRPYLVIPYLNKLSVNEEYFLNDVFIKQNNSRIEFAMSIEHVSSSDCNEIFINLICSMNCWAVTRFDWEDLCYIIHEDGDIMLYRRDYRNSTMTIDIIARMWGNSTVDFKTWVCDWYNCEFCLRFNSTYKIEDLTLMNAKSFSKECLLQSF